METLFLKKCHFISLKTNKKRGRNKKSNTQKRERTTEKPNAVSLLSLYRKRSKYQRAPGNDKLLIMFL
jgi:hypothetical protein